MYEQWSWWHFISTVLVCKGGGLFYWREVLGGGRRVDVPDLDPRWRRSLDVTFRWTQEERLSSDQHIVDEYWQRLYYEGKYV